MASPEEQHGYDELGLGDMDWSTFDLQAEEPMNFDITDWLNDVWNDRQVELVNDSAANPSSSASNSSYEEAFFQEIDTDEAMVQSGDDSKKAKEPEAIPFENPAPALPSLQESTKPSRKRRKASKANPRKRGKKAQPIPAKKAKDNPKKPSKPRQSLQVEPPTRILRDRSKMDPVKRYGTEESMQRTGPKRK